MKKLFLFLCFALGLAVVNALVDSTKECECRGDCWCKQPGLRHFRWVFPVGHSIPSRGES